jgi:peptide methionine sulfoxide reductase MsrA
MKNPDYGNLGDHTETLQIDYDPQRITYGELLDIFWKSHKPIQRSWKRQYMNAVFYHNETQRQAALASKKAVAAKIGREVRTEILPVRTFYRAEDYHQKYLLNRRSEFAKAMARIYPRKTDYVDSTAVARLNGYVGGYGGSEQLEREIDQLGLNAENRQALLELVGRKRTGWFN